MEKHLADMSLLVGDLKMAFHWYTSALQLMRPHQRDNLWYASVNEGLGVTAIVMKLCEEVLGQKAQGFTLNLGPLRKVKHIMCRLATLFFPLKGVESLLHHRRPSILFVQSSLPKSYIWCGCYINLFLLAIILRSITPYLVACQQFQNISCQFLVLRWLHLITSLNSDP